MEPESWTVWGTIILLVSLCFIANYLGHISAAVEQIARHAK